MLGFGYDKVIHTTLSCWLTHCGHADAGAGLELWQVGSRELPGQAAAQGGPDAVVREAAYGAAATHPGGPGEVPGQAQRDLLCHFQVSSRMMRDGLCNFCQKN